MPEATTLKRTPLYDVHAALGAKIVPFAGFEMPVQYPTGITAEHKAVREKAGLFDVSHMGEFIVRGPQAVDFVSYVTTNDVAALKPGQAHYSTILREDGTIVDDCLVYRADDRVMMVVNGSNIDKDFAHISRFLKKFPDAKLENISDQIALLALQGPDAARILQQHTDVDLSKIKYYEFTTGKVAGVDKVYISRTGYTGEDGFELYFPGEHAKKNLERAHRVGRSDSGRTRRARLAASRDGDGALRQRSRRHHHAPRSFTRLARQDEKG